MAEAAASATPVGPPDPQLAARVREFDHEALDLLFARTFERVSALLALAGGPQAVEAAATRVYARVLEGAARLEGGAQEAENWVLRLAAAEKSPAGAGPLDPLGHAEREVVLLRLGAGLGGPAAAEVLFRRPAQVEQVLARALQQLAGVRLPTVPAGELGQAVDRGAFEGAPELEEAGRLRARARPAPPEVALRVRSQFLGAAGERRALWVHRNHVPAGVPWARRRKPKLHIGEGLALFLIGVLAIGVGVMLSILAALSDPASPFGLYTMKRGGENVLLLVQRDRVKHADLQLKLSQTRRKEAESMAASGRPELAVQATRDLFASLRGAMSDLTRVPNRNAAWVAERDRVEQEASKPPTLIENSLNSAGAKQQANEVKALNEQFQADRKELDANLGVKLKPATTGPAQVGATPTPTPPQ